MFALIAGCPSEGVSGLADAPRSPTDVATSQDATGEDGSPGLRAEADCFDFADDNLGGGTDCVDTTCGTRPICCALGSAAAGCCVPGAPEALDITGCATGPADACVTGDGFGSYGLDTALSTGCGMVRGFVPTANPDADSGLVLDRVLDTNVARVVLSFTLGSTGSGLARSGVGLVPDGPVGARVRPAAAVELAGQRLRVIVGDVVVAEQTAPAGACAGVVPVTFTVSPGGTYTLTVDGVNVVDGEGLALPAQTRVVLYGRRDVDGQAWVSDVSVQRDLCNRIAPERSSAPVLTGAPADAVVGRVSVARRTPAGLGRAVIEIDGNLLPATELDTGIRVDSVANPLVTTGRAVVGEPDWAGGTVDPQLVAIDGGYLLLFAGIDDDGSTAIFVTELGTELDRPSLPRSILESGNSALVGPVTRIDSPAYFHEGARNLLFFRAVTADGSELRFFTLTEPLEVTARTASLPSFADAEARYQDLTPAVGVLRTSGAGFSRDEIGSVRVVALADGVFRLFYAGRRGTRWSIGALVTPDFVHFDDANGGQPLVGPSEAGFDGLGVLHPEPVRTSAASEAGLLLYYTGTTGLRTALGAARQAIPGGP